MEPTKFYDEKIIQQKLNSESFQISQDAAAAVAVVFLMQNWHENTISAVMHRITMLTNYCFRLALGLVWHQNNDWTVSFDTGETISAIITESKWIIACAVFFFIHLCAISNATDACQLF